MEGQKLGQPPTTRFWWRCQIESNLNLMFLSAPRSCETSPASFDSDPALHQMSVTSSTRASKQIKVV